MARNPKEKPRGHHRAIRRIATPEGVAIPIELADRGERMAAFLIDILLLYGALFLIGLTLFLVFISLVSGDGETLTGWLLSLFILIQFLVRSFYFAYFELRWNGTTPGKRALGLRVVSRDGRPLTGGAIMARNLMREVEIFLPISVFASVLDAPGSDLLTLSMAVWLGAMVLLPFLNTDRLRAGDLLAGTWVIALPKAALAPDLARQEPAVAEHPRETYDFTARQMDVYGIYELQTLEDILRSEGPASADTRREVARRIARKIAWHDPEGAAANASAFLDAFYVQLRKHLESRLAFGVRRADKNDPGGAKPPGPSIDR